MSSSEPWILVSNRLPFSFDPESSQYRESSGGLITAIKGIQDQRPIHWFGIVDHAISSHELAELHQGSRFTYHPVFVEPEQYDLYYNKFCNDVLWPILHLEPFDFRLSDDAWQAYTAVNRTIAEHLLEFRGPESMVWVHDFHLMLVAQFVKAQKPEQKAGFFLHTPFPAPDIYRRLTMRRELLHALLQYDLLGFHDYSYLRHFTSASHKILGASNSLLSIDYEGQNTQLGVFPVSIDTAGFQKKAQSPETEQVLADYQKLDQAIILGVDRLDYIKGIELKLEAFRRLLENQPELIGEVVFLQVAVPSRQQVPVYHQLRHRIEHLVGQINGLFGSPQYTPVHYLYQSVSLPELLALYRAARVLFNASKQDGMNLVCLEYCASQDPADPGIPVVSEFTGVVSLLSKGMVINPWNIEDTARTLASALDCPLAERREAHAAHLSFLQQYTATDWANSFMRNLRRLAVSQRPVHKEHLFDYQSVEQLARRFQDPHVIFLDYDGTLVPIQDNPATAFLQEDMRAIIDQVVANSHHRIVIVSGRQRDFLLQQFSDWRLDMAAEHGAYYYSEETEEWKSLVLHSIKEWYSEARKIMSDYQKRTPLSHLEEKRFSLTWHYRRSPEEFADFQSKKMIVELEHGLANYPVKVSCGKKVVEVKAVEANKGVFANWYKSTLKEKHRYLFIGDDVTDEDMFETAARDDLTVKVGYAEDSHARVFVQDHQEVKSILEFLLRGLQG